MYQKAFCFGCKHCDVFLCISSPSPSLLQMKKEGRKGKERKGGKTVKAFLLGEILMCVCVTLCKMRNSWEMVSSPTSHPMHHGHHSLHSQPHLPAHGTFHNLQVNSYVIMHDSWPLSLPSLLTLYTQ